MTIALNQLKIAFYKLFNDLPLFIARAPGRAEIIGNHTDYNFGYALGAAIEQSTYCVVSKRKDNQIHAYSEEFDSKMHIFNLTEIHDKNGGNWTNYLKAVVSEISKFKQLNHGFNIRISSNVPASGGVSSSAALEISIGLCLSKLLNINLTPFELALLCQKAENGPLVNSPCGFLDQGTSTFAKEDHLVFFDFLPSKNRPVSRISYIYADFQKHQSSFIIAVDKNIKRNLGESGYPARRKSCEHSLPIISKLLGKKISSLREFSVGDYEKYKNLLKKIDAVMTRRIEHIVYENQRVLDSVSAIKNNEINKFGNLINNSGHSALKLYDLNEKTPELTFLLETARKINGVIGVRNMGGGFSANILALVKNVSLDAYMNKLADKYKKKYNNILEFIVFNPSKGAEVYAV